MGPDELLARVRTSAEDVRAALASWQPLNEEACRGQLEALAGAAGDLRRFVVELDNWLAISGGQLPAPWARAPGCPEPLPQQAAEEAAELQASPAEQLIAEELAKHAPNWVDADMVDRGAVNCKCGVRSQPQPGEVRGWSGYHGHVARVVMGVIRKAQESIVP